LFDFWGGRREKGKKKKREYKEEKALVPENWRGDFDKKKKAG